MSLNTLLSSKVQFRIHINCSLVELYASSAPLFSSYNCAHQGWTHSHVTSDSNLANATTNFDMETTNALFPVLSNEENVITCSELQMRRILNIALRGEVLFPAWSTLWWNHCAINWQEIWMRIKSPIFIKKKNKQWTNWEKRLSWDYWIIKWQDFQVTRQICHPWYNLSKWKYISA